MLPMLKFFSGSNWNSSGDNLWRADYFGALFVTSTQRYNAADAATNYIWTAAGSEAPRRFRMDESFTNKL